MADTATLPVLHEMVLSDVMGALVADERIGSVDAVAVALIVTAAVTATVEILEGRAP